MPLGTTTTILAVFLISIGLHLLDLCQTEDWNGRAAPSNDLSEHLHVLEIYLPKN